MPRPEFTKDEEHLIAQCRLQDTDRGLHIFTYCAWIVFPTLLFGYGMIRAVPECVLTGFIMIAYVAARFTFYHLRPSWSMKPIIEKYEEACR